MPVSDSPDRDPSHGPTAEEVWLLLGRADLIVRGVLDDPNGVQRQHWADRARSWLVDVNEAWVASGRQRSRDASTGAGVRLLVTGSRAWKDADAIERELRTLRPDLVIAGGAPGADRLAAAAARRLRIEVREFPAAWEQHGRRAGVLRNLDMLQRGKPTRVLAFHDDLAVSRGTQHMCRIAVEAGLPVLLVEHVGGERGISRRELTDVSR